MLIKILLIIAIIAQTVATIFAVRLVRTTKYNGIWLLFILGFSVLSAERYLQLVIYNGAIVPMKTFYFTGVVVSIGLSVGVMYAHKLFTYIERLNQQRALVERRILTAVLRAEEFSRSRFSKDLHDGLGPLLSSAKMSLSVLNHEPSEEQRTEIIRNTTYVIDEAIRSLREISNNLSPHILSDFGLKRALSTFMRHNIALQKSTKIEFNTNVESLRFEMDIEVVLYRVICELINNSLKHADASLITISLQHRNKQLLLEYSDNGRGFDPDAMLNCGMGLSNLSSRINSLNGTIELTSQPDAGMSANIKIDIRAIATNETTNQKENIEV